MWHFWVFLLLLFFRFKKNKNLEHFGPRAEFAATFLAFVLDFETFLAAFVATQSEISQIDQNERWYIDRYHGSEMQLRPRNKWCFRNLYKHKKSYYILRLWKTSEITFCTRFWNHSVKYMYFPRSKPNARN